MQHSKKLINENRLEENRRITFNDQDFSVTEYGSKRVGRPKHEWWKKALEKYWSRVWYCVKDEKNERHLDHLTNEEK